MQRVKDHYLRNVFLIGQTKVSVSGRLFRKATLRHEGFEYLEDPLSFVQTLRSGPAIADVFTFLGETPGENASWPFRRETDSISVLPVTSFDHWWKNLDFRVRNKIRKAQKGGVELRMVQLTEEFVLGVKGIYDESPIRQGRSFRHYGQPLAVVKQHLESFPECTCFIGAFLGNEMIGFMKLFQGRDILRTVHIIAKLSQRQHAIQDAMIAKAVEICEQRKISRLHYGMWSSGSLGAFKLKHGFERLDFPRYYVPLTLRGKGMLSLNLHRRVQDYVPVKWARRLIALRTRWNSFRHGEPKGMAAGG